MSPARSAALAVTAAGCAVALSVQGTHAAFTASTDTPGSFTAGTVWVSDDDAAAALFTATALAPGATAEKCIAVTYDGTMAAEIRLHTGYFESDPVGDGAVLDSHLNITVQYDTSTTGTFAGCGDFVSEGTLYTGTIEALATTHDNFARGVLLGPAATAWAPAPNQVRVFKVIYTLSATAPTEVQGDGVNAVFTWEAQNT